MTEVVIKFTREKESRPYTVTIHHEGIIVMYGEYAFIHGALEALSKQRIFEVLAEAETFDPDGKTKWRTVKAGK